MKAKEKNNVAKQYINKIRPIISCCKSDKYFFLQELGDVVNAYVDDHPEATLKMLYAEFGSPEQLESSIFTRDDYVKMFKRAEAKAKICKWITIAAVTVAIIAIVCLFAGDNNAIITDSGVSYY